MSQVKLKRIVKPVYFGNWGDLWGFPLASKLVPFTMPFPFITPNAISIAAFIIFIWGSLSLFLNYPFHLIVSVIFLPLAFLLDDLDGQVARAKNMRSDLGNYFDKTFDVLKIYVVTASLSYAVYLQTQNILYIFLGFTACFFFNFRYYMKLETVLHQVELDPEYLDKSSKVMNDIEEETYTRHKKLEKTLWGRVLVFWEMNRTFFFVDEAEFAVFTAFFALINRLDMCLWVLSVSQVILGMWRWYERGHQTNTKSSRLYYFMRK